ncbi:MAG: cytochrome c4 [Betaproteobacteria bacterium]|jgi:cytochrome c553|nr:cytochrome c4 [Betaproteobacteria bacterium]
MKPILFGLVLSLALLGCGKEKEPTAKSSVPEKSPAATATATAMPAADIAAGKALAEKTCKSCHGLDGKGAGPAIPHLAAQRERSLVASLKEYKEGKRTHSGLRDIVAKMTDADIRNIAAYYAAQPPVAAAGALDMAHSTPYEQGRKLSEPCAKCHGVDGNATARGTPSLAGQQPTYLIAAIHEYHRGERAKGAMKSTMGDSDRLELENLAAYYSAQTPVQRPVSARGDVAAGEKLSTMCGGCHGAKGVSRDAATPSLAGQDFDYLLKATKAYWTTRKSWGMQRYVSGLGDKDVENIVAFYAAQKPLAADKVPGPIDELAAKCNRCHDDDSNPAMVAPKLRGQDRDYLIMAMREYRDDKRESSAMHRMSFPYGNAMIESIATWFAKQPAK